MANDKTVTWNAVKRLFQGADIGYMHMLGYRLDDYAYVAGNAQVLLGRIKDKSMPPKPFLPWTDEMIQLFQAWIDGGFVKFDPDIAARENDFIELSQFLTGFDDLKEDPELASAYHDLLRESASEAKPGRLPDPTLLETMIEKFSQLGAEAFEEQILQSTTATDMQDAARIVITLWYTGSFWNSAGFPADNRAAGNLRNQYPEGLAWRAASCHPMGYASEGYRTSEGQFSLKGQPYWHYQPEDEKNTGLGNVNP